MKALVLRGPEDLGLLEVPEPDLCAGEVLVRVRACGICGSDLRYYRGHNPWAKQTLGVDAPNPPNMILGHEVAGEIAAVGAGVSPDRIGERVALLAYKGCGVCRYCRTGRENLCEDTLHLGHGAGWGEREFYPGGMATYCPVWADMAYELPDHVPFDAATQLDGLGVAVRAVHRAALQPMDRVVVLGAGPIGLMIMQTAKAYGARKVIVTEVSAMGSKVAREMGADLVLDPKETDIVPLVLDTYGGADVVFDTVGEAETLRQGMRMLARGGRLVALAIKPERLTLEAALFSGERTLTTTANSPYPDFQRAIDLLASGRIDLSPMITHHFPLDKGLEAFAVGLDRQNTGAVKVIITP